MKILIPFAYFIFSAILVRSQQRLIPSWQRLIIDSGLQNEFFESDNQVSIATPSNAIVKNMGTGRVDTFYYKPIDTVLIRTARVSSNIGMPFDFCISYFNGDTLVIKLQEPEFLPSSELQEKIVIHIIGNRFQVLYESVGPRYNLVADTQYFAIKKLVKRKGERLMGELKVRFINQDLTSKEKFVDYAGAIDCIIE